jgi:hypothetical protein
MKASIIHNIVMDHNLGQLSPVNNSANAGSLPLPVYGAQGASQQVYSDDIVLPPLATNAEALPVQNVPAPRTAFASKELAKGQETTSYIARDQVVLGDEEGDKLDEEWIEKARAIVNKTQHDPYTQTKEISRLRAQFMKARYDKNIKVTEDAK